MPPEVGAKKPLPETAIAVAKDLEKNVPLVDLPDAAKDLGDKLAKIKSFVLKLDAFKRELPRDIPKDHYFMTYSGITKNGFIDHFHLLHLTRTDWSMDRHGDRRVSLEHFAGGGGGSHRAVRAERAIPTPTLHRKDNHRVLCSRDRAADSWQRWNSCSKIRKYKSNAIKHRLGRSRPEPSCCIH